MGGFFTGVKTNRRGAETLRKTKDGEENGGMGRAWGLRLYGAGTGDLRARRERRAQRTKDANPNAVHLGP
jgi:hypothetical protein